MDYFNIPTDAEWTTLNLRTTTRVAPTRGDVLLVMLMSLWAKRGDFFEGF